MGDWTKHGSDTYNCSRFQVKDDATRNSARSQLERYLFYYDRFHAHRQSIQSETKVRAPRVLGVLVAVAHDRHDDTEPMANGARASYVDVQFLEQTVDVLSKCRRTLLFTRTRN